MEKNKYGIGIDVGSVSICAAVYSHHNWPDHQIHSFSQLKSTALDPDMYIYISPYIRHYGSPEKKAAELLEKTMKAIQQLTDDIQLVATGSGGRQVCSHLNAGYINDFKAVSVGVAQLYPECRTVFELGGEQAKFISLQPSNCLEQVQILDYETNGDCAAGTGAFFDQQAARLHYSIEDVSDAVCNVDRAAHIAGRCSVFAKSDMIHAQQRGYSPEEVLKGLCDAVVRNFKGSITKGKSIELPVVLSGGVFRNNGIVTAIRDTFEWNDGEMVVSEYASWFNAIGAAIKAHDATNTAHCVSNNFATVDTPIPRTYALSMENVTIVHPEENTSTSSSQVIDAYLGVDIGSVSINLALIDSSGHLLDGIYTMTKGRPIEVVSKALAEMAGRMESAVRIKGVGTTGSGRELIGMLVGADVIKDEISAHKCGALEIAKTILDTSVDTIFEIGGQDAKFISLKDDIVVDFTLNDACAAGTGSFLEEQAKELEIAIKDEFAELALSSIQPLKMGERCTVFMEKELKPYLHQGVEKADIAAGLALSIVHNYLNRVVKKRPIGDVIFFQGGTAYNKAVAAAFATILNKKIIIPPHNGLIGAIGVGLLARDCNSSDTTKFRGWHLDAVSWNKSEIHCKACENRCIVQKFEVGSETSYWGDKCSTRFRKSMRSTRMAVADDLFSFQSDLIRSTMPPPLYATGSTVGTVAIPMVMQFWDRLPFWRNYFNNLGIDVQLTGPSNKNHVNKGVETAVAEPCFPIQMAHGHLHELLDSSADWIFLPNIVNEEDPTDSVASFLCPWAQTLPLVSRFAPALETIKAKIWHPNIQFRMGSKFNEERLWESIKDKWPIKRSLHRQAWKEAEFLHKLYLQKCIEAGSRALAHIQSLNRDAVLLIGRPYNLYDQALNLNIPSKLRNQYGIDVLPMDFVDLDAIDINHIHDHMFWNYGRRILQAAAFSKDYDNLHLIYLSNFKCGPDSYIRHYIEEAAGEPFLFLQLDSHANDAGIMTRIEAFLESKRMR
ncbi:hypothetical protein KAR48_19245 [bacterium]|nr:hypothetical protein [bacterium]